MDERVLTLEGRAQFAAELRDELERGPRPRRESDPGDITTADLLRIVGLPVVDPERWALSAACAVDPQSTDPRTDAAAREALTRCQTCPVLAECRTWLDGEPEFEGIAGGMWVRLRSVTPRVTLADLTREDAAA
jgi:hypothetical protein